MQTKKKSEKKPVVVFWGTYDTGKARCKILLDGAQKAGIEVIQCHRPVWSTVRDKSLVKGLISKFKILLKTFFSYPKLVICYLKLPRHDAVLVPYPGILDIFMLWPFARIRTVPLYWDVFISLYDTFVNDRKMVSRYSPHAWLLYAVEWLAARLATQSFLDTRAQADYFETFYHLKSNSVGRVLVGAEEFFFNDFGEKPVFETNNLFTVFYYGQFIPLQGIDVMVNAVKILEEDGVTGIQVFFVGEGQERKRIDALIRELDVRTIKRFSWKEHEELVYWIKASDVNLGIFGRSGKAGRVIPTRVFQLLAMKHALITMDSPALRELLELKGHYPFLYLIPPNDPKALAEKIIELKSKRPRDSEKWKDGRKLEGFSLSPLEVGMQLRALIFPGEKDER